METQQQGLAEEEGAGTPGTEVENKEHVQVFVFWLCFYLDPHFAVRIAIYSSWGPKGTGTAVMNYKK